jgi:hypothetical protein
VPAPEPDQEARWHRSAGCTVAPAVLQDTAAVLQDTAHTGQAPAQEEEAPGRNTAVEAAAHTALGAEAGHTVEVLEAAAACTSSAAGAGCLHLRCEFVLVSDGPCPFPTTFPASCLRRAGETHIVDASCCAVPSRCTTNAPFLQL